MTYDEAFRDLADVYLEDSWVLEIAPSDRLVAFRLDAVLTESHPVYAPPEPGNQHCYRRGWLSIESAEDIEVRLSGAVPATDFSGETDLGQIDAFQPLGSERWQLEGSWGSAIVTRPKVSLRLD